jgi:hypothetical protein
MQFASVFDEVKGGIYVRPSMRSHPTVADISRVAFGDLQPGFKHHGRVAGVDGHPWMNRNGYIINLHNPVSFLMATDANGIARRLSNSSTRWHV